jgi:hypothetical protein
LPVALTPEKSPVWVPTKIASAAAPWSAATRLANSGSASKARFMQKADRLLRHLGASGLRVGAHERKLDVVVKESAVVAAGEHDLHPDPAVPRLASYDWCPARPGRRNLNS